MSISASGYAPQDTAAAPGHPSASADSGATRRQATSAPVRAAACACGTATSNDTPAPAPAPDTIDFAAFRDPALARKLISEIRELTSDRALNLMEVCGTHTVSIGRYGFRSIMPPHLKLLSGPGCPVCVTANRDIDHAIALAKQDGVTVCVFGDMMRVPGSTTSLAAEKAAGRDIRVVYSPLDALALAEEHPEHDVIFMGVGFETTTPAIAACILEAAARDLANFSIYGSHKVTPPVLRAIAEDPDTHIDGFILPGHVSTITGLAPYQFLADDFGIPGVVTGFEPVDILEGIAMLVHMATTGAPAIKNAYRRGVNADGNPVARQLMAEVFEPCDATWRGLGLIPGSGLKIRPAFARFDAAARYDVAIEPTREPAGCRCGDVLRGAITPNGCPLFGRACTPEHPVGPCMVSSEGSCAAYFRYHEQG